MIKDKRKAVVYYVSVHSKMMVFWLKDVVSIESE
jgi:hypothetical protein